MAVAAVAAVVVSVVPVPVTAVDENFLLTATPAVNSP